MGIMEIIGIWRFLGCQGGFTGIRERYETTPHPGTALGSQQGTARGVPQKIPGHPQLLSPPLAGGTPGTAAGRSQCSQLIPVNPSGSQCGRRWSSGSSMLPPGGERREQQLPPNPDPKFHRDPSAGDPRAPPDTGMAWKS